MYSTETKTVSHGSTGLSERGFMKPTQGNEVGSPDSTHHPLNPTPKPDNIRSDTRLLFAYQKEYVSIHVGRLSEPK